jgi:asparagine synthase (glutamine-hydrolysing)
MCGICGFVDYQFQSDAETLANMVSTLNHRGPDDKGHEVYSCDQALIGIGHSRLSILDLTNAGHQPMCFNDLIISFNGEIYNFRELKKELIGLGHFFKSESDTEVILHAFDEWGNSCISKFIGMFAFIIFNKKTFEMTFVRDRAGVKPLYYYWDENLLLFASELKAFYKHPGFQKKINVGSVHQYFDFGYIPSPNSIFENCCKLEPGHILNFKIVKRNLSITKYWDVRDFYVLPGLNISFTEAKEELSKLLYSAFNYRMVSDVPVGIFLSGGYDSTGVASILQSKRTKKLKTFTIGFEEGNNEAPFARQIARHLGTDHTEYYCTTKEAQAIIPNLPYYYDEPFADSSAIPTILVSNLARKNVTVALSADAGDEIFAGYENYRTFLKNLSIINSFPRFSRKIISQLSTLASHIFTNGFLNHKLVVFADIININEKFIPQSLLKSFYTLNNKVKSSLFINPAISKHTIYEDNYNGFKDDLSIALATDYMMYLQNDILSKVDRATMSVSLEGREPYLDHRIAEFAAQLPSDFKYGTTQKMILKEIVFDYIPKALMQRPKSGFSIPIYSWLQKDLSYLVENNLNSTAIARTDIFNTDYVLKIKNYFLSGRLSDPTIIWKLIQFQMWYNMWLN